MTDREFLEAVRLRINLSNDLASLGYCDFLEPKRYFVGAPDPRIEGIICFIGDQTGQLKFELLLPVDTESLEGVVWDSLLPLQHSRGWARMNDDRVTIDVSTPPSADPPRVAAA
jgi:hypothetical protein